MEFYAGILIFFIVLVFLLSHRKQKSVEAEQYNLELSKQIVDKTKQLQEIEKQIENRTIDRTQSLSQVEIKVLDMYDQSNIKIPVDIIEDLSFMRLTSEKEISDYIENQRYFWKLENSKKPFKGGK